MASKNYEIEIIKDPAKLEAWTAAQYSSFVGTGNVIHDVLFPPAHPPTPAQVKLSAKRHKASFEKDSEHNIFIQITNPLNGEIMGGAKWQLWPYDPKRSGTAPVTFIDDSTEQGKIEREFAQKVMDAFQSRRARDMAMPHGLLDICYTVPGHERKGVASALVAWGLEKCDAEGWVAFTEASIRGWRVYERLGFERKELVSLRYDDLGEYAKGMGDVVWIFMIRPAKQKE